jgi:hypothetical protein
VTRRCGLGRAGQPGYLAVVCSCDDRSGRFGIQFYQANYSGNHEEIRRYALFGAVASVQYDRWKGFAETCMAECDLESWTTPDLIDSHDVAVSR